MHAACTIRLSINKDLKLKKRKGKDKQQRKKLYTITWSREGHVTLVCHDCRFASAVTTGMVTLYTACGKVSIF